MTVKDFCFLIDVANHGWTMAVSWALPISLGYVIACTECNQQFSELQ